MSDLLQTIDLDSAPNPTVSVIWMHGLGADATNFVPVARDLDLKGLPGIRFVFPNARTMPVTLNGGYPMRAWFDVYGLGASWRPENWREDEAGLRASQRDVEALIAREKARGIPASRIVVAGFSQGCAMTLQTGLRHPEKLAGLLCLSGWLPLHKQVAQERTEASLDTPIFMSHGQFDDVVPLARAQQSRDILKEMGYQVEWHDYPMAHQVIPAQERDISAWLRKILA